MIFPFVIAGLILSGVGLWLLDLAGWQLLWGLPLWLGGIVVSLVLYTLFLIVVSLFLRTDTAPKKPHPFLYFLTVYSMGVLTKLAGIRVQARGLEKLPKDGRFLLAANHRSLFDPLVINWALRKYKLVFVMKPEILKIPIAGPLARASGYLPLDRDNDRAALKTILHAAKLLQEDVCSVGIFPEGTRSRTSGLLPFRNGAFKIAQRAKAPVVVVRLQHVDEAASRFPWRTTHVTLDVCGVLDSAEVAAAPTTETGERVRALLEGGSSDTPV